MLVAILTETNYCTLDPGKPNKVLGGTVGKYNYESSDVETR